MQKAKEYSERSDYTPEMDSRDPETMDLDLKMWRPSGSPKEKEINVSVPIGSLV